MRAQRPLLLVALLGLVVVAVAAYFRYRLENPPAVSGSGEVIVEIPAGTPTSAIFRRLARAGVVEDARLAEIYYRLHRRRIPLQAGEYRFRRAMPIDEVINMMGRGDVVKHAIVVPEGLTAEETFELFSKEGIGGPDAFRDAAREDRARAGADPRGLGPRGLPLSRHVRRDAHHARRPDRGSHGRELPRALHARPPAPARPPSD